MAFSLISNRQTEVQVFDVWSSVKNPVSVFTDPNIMEFLQFSWIPDGRYLAFVGRDHVGNSRLYVWDGESTRSLHSLEFDIDSGSVFWSVDNQLAFSLRLQGLREEQPWPNDIYLWDGHQTINLSQTPDREERVISWSRGGHLAYTSRVTHSDSPVVVMVWDGINFIQISPDFVNLYWIGWNNDNEMTLSGVRQLSDTQMQMYRWDGEQVINITPNPGEKYIYQIWSPDGRWAVGLIHDRAIWADELEMRDANNHLLLKMPSPRYPIWTEGGSLLFCQIQPQGWVLQQWDGKNVRPVTQNTISRVIVPISGRLYCQ